LPLGPIGRGPRELERQGGRAAPPPLWASARRHKGLSFAPVRSIRSAAPLLLAFLLLLGLGCSRRVEKLVGNARLIRGGLGTTSGNAIAPDRDTTVDPSTRNFGRAVLVGQEAGFEARGFLKVAAWSLPDTTDPTLVVQQVKLVLPRDTLRTAIGIKMELARVAADWDTTTVAYPGPAAADFLGSATDSLDGVNFEIPLAAGTFTQVKQWAGNPTSVPGFILRSIQGAGVGAYRSGQITFRILYQHLVSSVVVSDSVETSVTQDFYLHTPLTPPTGGETTLALGGLYETSAPLRFPVPAIPAGSSINQATLVLRVLSGSPLFATGQSVDVEIRRVGASWSEAVTTFDSLQAASLLATRAGVAIAAASDSLITIALPGGLIRDWADLPASNEGIVVSLRGANVAPEIRIGSRESASPPELRVAHTTPPPGRF